LELVRRTRDLLMDALAASVLPPIEQLEVLAELSNECQLRGGGSEPDALPRLLFQTRRLQAERERRIAHVRRQHFG
jgi:hypothetical protein